MKENGKVKAKFPLESSEAEHRVPPQAFASKIISMGVVHSTYHSLLEDSQTSVREGPTKELRNLGKLGEWGGFQWKEQAASPQKLLLNHQNQSCHISQLSFSRPRWPYLHKGDDPGKHQTHQGSCGYPRWWGSHVSWLSDFDFISKDITWTKEAGSVCDVSQGKMLFGRRWFPCITEL